MLAALGEPHDPALDPALRAAVAAVAAGWAARTGRALMAATAEEVGPLLAGHAGPVVLVAPDVPRLDDELAAAALSDIAAGCVLSFAPATDGKPYLLAFADARPEALALLTGADRRREALFAEAMALGDEVGLLRSERRVVTPADARALALDPLVPEPLRSLAARHA
ncbi:MAG: hypothetical protein ACJ762_14485 [Solirubrobacteraceae bacterium]